MRRMRPEPLEAAAFAPFGAVIEALGSSEAINDGTTQRFSNLATLDLRAPRSDPVIGIYVASARAFPLRIARLERHRQAAQVFLPLGSQRFIVVVGGVADSPQWEGLRAFLSAPGQGVSLARGCWHHGLIALGDGDRFAVIEGGDYRRDTEEVAAPGPIELDFTSS